MNVMMFTAGLANLAIAAMLISITIVPMINCKTLVYGRCAGLEMVRGYRGSEHIYPNFEYEFGGKSYNGRSIFSINKRAISSYQYGTTRLIWIDENSPKKFIARRLSTGDVIFLIFGAGSIFGLGSIFTVGSFFVS